MMSETGKGKLTHKQSFFCKEYIKDFNGTRACIAAGYSKKTANRMASENLSKPVLRECIAKAIKKRSDKADVDAQWVLDELVKLHKVSLKDFVRTDKNTGQPYFDLKNASDEQMKALNSLQIENGFVGRMPVSRIKLSVNDRIKVLEAIGKHVNVNAFKESVNVMVPIQINIDKEDEEL